MDCGGALCHRSPQARAARGCGPREARSSPGAGCRSGEADAVGAHISEGGSVAVAYRAWSIFVAVCEGSLLTYFVTLNTLYLLFAVIAFVELRRHRRRWTA